MPLVTAVITIGDVRTTTRTQQRHSEADMRRLLTNVAGRFVDTYTVSYDPNAGQWDGTPEGTAVAIGTLREEDLPALREYLAFAALVYDQEAIGLIVQGNTD